MLLLFLSAVSGGYDSTNAAFANFWQNSVFKFFEKVCKLVYLSVACLSAAFCVTAAALKLAGECLRIELVVGNVSPIHKIEFMWIHDTTLHVIIIIFPAPSNNFWRQKLFNFSGKLKGQFCIRTISKRKGKTWRISSN